MVKEVLQNMPHERGFFMTNNNKLRSPWMPKADTVTVLLARHCQTTMNIRPELVGGRSNDASLTPKGISQAEQLGKWLFANQVAPKDVYTYTALRTQQTARVALAAMGIDEMPITKTPDILELSQGEAEGIPRDEVYTNRVLQAIKEQGKDFKQPGGESMNDVGQRMIDWLNTLPQEEAIHLTVTHGGSIKYLASLIYGWRHSTTYRQQIDNGSITVVTRNLSTPSNWQVNLLNHPTS